MPLTEVLRWVIEIDTNRAANAAATSSRRIQGDLDAVEKKTMRTGGAFRDWGTKALAVGVALEQVGRVVMDFANAAGRLEQSVGASEAVFGDAADSINDFAANSVDAVGLSEAAFRELATVTGASLKNMGFSVEEAATQSEILIQRGADLAAMFGGTTQDAVRALTAAFRGEADPAEQFGLRLQVAAVNAKAVEMGLARTTSEVDAHARAQATLALIMEQSADAANQFAEEEDTLVGQQQRANAAWEDAKATLGQGLLPFVTTATESMSAMAQIAGGDLPQGFDAWLEAMTPAARLLERLGVGPDGRPADEVLSGIAARSEEAAEAARRHADAVANEQARLEELTDTLRAQTDPLFAVVDATQDWRDAQRESTEAAAAVTEAQNDYNEAVAAHGPNSDEAREASENLAGAQRDLAAAEGEATRAAFDLDTEMVDLAIGIQNGNVDLETAVARLGELEDQGLLTADQADAMEQQFREAAANANIHGSVTMETAEARRRIQELLALIRTAQATARSATMNVALAQLGGKQAGGPVAAHTAHIVGERGPELLVTGSQAGFIVPNHQLVRPPAPGITSTAGATLNVTINAGVGSDPVDIGRRVVAYVKQYERANGTGWRN